LLDPAVLTTDTESNELESRRRQSSAFVTPARSWSRGRRRRNAAACFTAQYTAQAMKILHSQRE